jgi:hypothetical protein
MKHKLVWSLVIGINLGFGVLNLVDGYNIYWANLHSHTSLSDGQGMVDEAYIYARDSANIDVLAITDHTHYLTANGYQYTRNIAEQFTEPGQFVALAGQEFGSLAAFGHFSTFEADILYPYSVNGLELFYDWIIEYKAISQFNHPRVGDFDNFTFNRNGNKYATMIEIVNGSGLYTSTYEELYILALNNGWHVAPVSNQDNHRKQWGNATTALGQIPLTGIWADSLTKEDILEAMLNKRVYGVEVKPANDRIYLRDFSIGNIKMGDVYYTSDKNINVNLSVDAMNDFSKIYLYKNGAISDSAIVDTNYLNITFADTMTNGYYFVKGVQQDGDRFWTAPIWVNYRVGPVGIEAWPNPIRTSSKIIFPDPEIVDPGYYPNASEEMSIYTIEGKIVYQEQTIMGEDHYWDGTDDKGNHLDDGVYFIVIKVNWGTHSKIFKGKVALLRRS